MKRISVLTIVLASAALLIACTTPRREPTLAAPTKVATAVPIESSTAAAVTEAGTPATEQVLEGPRISYAGIHFLLDPALGSRVYVYDDVISLDGSTAHSTRFALSPEDHCTTWCVVIYPITQFEQVFGSFVFPPAGYRGGAAVIFKAQEKALTFQDGHGTRALEAFGQNHYGVSNESLKFVFRGYTPDGRYGLFMQAPARARGLPDAAPTLTSTGDPAHDILDYNEQAAASLSSLPATDFTPDLDLLDGLVKSIRVDTR